MEPNEETGAAQAAALPTDPPDPNDNGSPLGGPGKQIPAVEAPTLTLADLQADVTRHSNAIAWLVQQIQFLNPGVGEDPLLEAPLIEPLRAIGKDLEARLEASGLTDSERVKVATMVRSAEEDVIAEEPAAEGV
jgi:hypothetical protein